VVGFGLTSDEDNAAYATRQTKNKYSIVSRELATIVVLLVTILHSIYKYSHLIFSF